MKLSHDSYCCEKRNPSARASLAGGIVDIWEQFICSSLLYDCPIGRPIVLRNSFRMAS
ncbi:hypothetical protein I6N90_20905 [Paenibacillus sp. GSMTC-2017]|uniref:hypothetical protein n=1 Tax=Paenibacillus sp. GSMTC-2017 TaxID=2794350 RepID=UPI0018D8F6EE|nr:hypothetical protein [Paenibacillus sp. GSMTC-2017]MBH5320255.1 hypothetical protein [Paenibacillus sp. GSMTC-2017]